MSIKKNLFSFFSDLFKNCKSKIFLILLCLIIFFNSGNCFVGFGANSLTKALIYLISFLVLAIIFVSTRDISIFKKREQGVSIKEIIKGYVFRPDVLSLLLILLISLINLLIGFLTGQAIKPTSIIGIIFTFFSAFLIVQIYSKETFFKCISNLTFALSIFALMFFGIVLFSKTFFNTNSFWSSTNMYDSYFGVFYYYSDAGYIIGNTQRLMGAFWEPSVFANFLCVGILIELFYAKKTNWLKIIIFLVCVFLTKSTGGYILCFILLLSYICKHLKKLWSSYFLIGFFVLLILCVIFNQQIIDFLAKISPEIFGKMAGDGSFLTRTQGPLIYFRIFSERPINGYGFDLALARYNEMVGNVLDSSTTTFPYIIASLGLSGILISVFSLVGMARFGNEKLNLPTRVLLVIFFFLMSNTQSHMEVLCFMTIYVYGIKELSRYRVTTNSFENNSSNTILAKIKSNSEAGTFSSNVIGSIVLKIGGIILGLLTIPIFSSYFKNDTIYGIWLTIISILTIILNFDFGISDGLKNKIIDAQKKNDESKIKILISNSYLITCFISLILLIVFSVLIWTLDWNSILSINTSDLDSMILKISMSLILITICIQLVLKNVVAILSAYKKIVLANSLMFFTNLFLLIFALIFSSITVNKILFMSIGYVVFVSLPLIIATFYAFLKVSKGNFPSFKLCDKEIIKSLSDLGLRFFIIQICNIILWGFNDFFISNIYSPEDVVTYAKLFKLFSTIVSLYSIIQPILWVYMRKYKNNLFCSNMKKLIYLACGISAVLVVGSLLAGLLCQPIMDIWLGSDTFECTFEIVLPFVLYGVIYSIFASVTVLCNSLEVLKSFTIVAILVGVLKIPLLYVGKIVFPNFNWILVMWINVILIVPLTFVPLISLIKKFRFEKRKQIKYE